MALIYSQVLVVLLLWTCATVYSTFIFFNAVRNLFAKE